MAVEPAAVKLPIRYVVTFGTSELFSGTHYAQPSHALACILADIFDEHYQEVLNTNNGAGSFKNEAYIQFINRQASIRISASKDGAAGILVQLQDQLKVIIRDGYNCFRFHLEEKGFSHVLDYRLRVQRFYSYYNPKKLVMVDRMLASARGFEDRLLLSMMKKYGPEPPPAVDLRFRERLTAFYTYYNPARVAEVDNILLQYNGMEEQLFGALVAKYGPEPIIAGSDAGSDDSFAYTTNDAEGEEERDRYPLTVPLMPFIAPIDPDDLPDDATAAQFTKDVHFWDNFVNQMPGEGERTESSAHQVGIDCNQELLQQFMRSYPYLFPHILTVCCPFKEQVFRASDAFVQQMKQTADATQLDVENADASHVVRAVSPHLLEPVFLTRKAWEELVASWQTRHGLQRRVKVGSIALEDADVRPQLPALPKPPPPPPRPPMIDTAAGPDTPATDPTAFFSENFPAPAPPMPIPEPLPKSSEPVMIFNSEQIDIEPYVSAEIKDPPKEARVIETQTGPWNPYPQANTKGPSPAKPRAQLPPQALSPYDPPAGTGMPTIHVRDTSSRVPAYAGPSPTRVGPGYGPGPADVAARAPSGTRPGRGYGAGPNPAASRGPSEPGAGRLAGRAGSKDHEFWQDLLRHQLANRGY